MKRLKNKTEINDKWWTQIEACTFCEVSPKTFRKWGLEPVAAFNSAKYYDSTEVINKKLDLAIQNRFVMGEYDELIDLEREQARKTQQERIKLELANAKTMREQAPVELLTFALENIITQFVAVLDGLPLTIKREMPDIPGVALDIVDREITKARNIMADAEIDFNQIDN